MARKSPMTNKTVIARLTDAGLITYNDIKTKADNFSVVFGRGWLWEWGGSYKDRRKIYTRNYMIPIDIFKDVINPKFKPQFKLGAMVRIRSKSTRMYKRNSARQAVGDSQSWAHMGIGSGKEYHSERLEEAMQGIPYWKRVMPSTKLLIGREYTADYLASLDKLKYYKHKGVKRQTPTDWKKETDFTIDNFWNHISLRADGLFGPKNIINGYITNIFVHFLYPKWTTKRECRYEITLDTGAKGIFTNDYLERVYDVDYEVDEKLMRGCPYQHECPTNDWCDHKQVHLHNPEECGNICDVSKHCCQAIYDFENLFDTTHGSAKDIEKEEANASPKK